MFPTALGRNIADRALENFEQCLLHAFAGNVARNAYVFRLARNLVNFVDVNDAALGALHVVIGILQQSQNDVLHVFTDVARFGERGGIGNGEWHVQHLGQGARQQRLAGTSVADHQDVALLQLHL